jgi:hypothetical protein
MDIPIQDATADSHDAATGDSINIVSDSNITENNSVNSFSWTTAVPRRKRSQLTNVDEPTKKLTTRDPRRYSTYFKSNVPTQLQTKNKFGVLQNDEPATSSAQGQQTPLKHTRPPPIHLRCDIKYAELQNALVNLVGDKNFHCVSTREGITIHPTDPEHYRTIVRDFRVKGVPFHTYQLPTDKAYRVVIRGLHHSVDTDTISSELTQRGFSVRQVANVISREKVSLPLFFVDLEPKGHNDKIFELDNMLSTRIKVEEPRPKRIVSQCVRCQRYGHTKSYCNMPPRCVRCAGSHLSKDCTKSRETPAICVLCNGEHPSNYRGCSVHKHLQNRRSPSSTKRTQAITSPPDINSHSGFPKLVTQHLESNLQSIPNQYQQPHGTYSRVTAQGQSIPNQYQQPHGTYSRVTAQGVNPVQSCDISIMMNSFITEIKSLITPMLTMLSQLVQMLVRSSGK